MIIKRISALVLSAAMILTSMPMTSFAANTLSLSDRDSSVNRVSKYAANGTLLGVDVEVLGLNDQGQNNYAYDLTRNPYQSDNGPLKVVVENSDKAVVEVSYNGKFLERISDQKQLLLYVNADDRVIVKAIDKPGDYQYDSWEFEYGNITKYYSDSTVTVDLSQEVMGSYDKVTLKPRTGSNDNSHINDPNHVRYELIDDYNGAFGIDRHTGVVFVKDNAVLMNSNGSNTSRDFSFYAFKDASVQGSYIRLTKNKRSQRGGYFSRETINLQNDFDLTYDALFGHRSNGHPGADGMVFVLTTTQPTTTGWNGGGLGYQSNSQFNNSVAIEFDSWHNDEYWVSDPYSSSNGSNHIAFIKNANVDHDNALTFKRANGSSAKSHSINLETNSYHDVRITWDADQQDLSLYMGNTLIGTLERDIISNDLNSNPNVYFGWVAATGSYSNNQRLDNISMSVESSPQIVVEASYGNDTGQITIPIEITETRENLDARTSNASLQEDQVKVLYASDHRGKIYKVDPDAKITEKIADSGIAWFDIANDKYTTLYGVKGDGALFSDIDENGKFVTDLSRPDKNINSLAVDESGNFYYVRDAMLKFYNAETGNITDIMDTTYQSLGDLVFHGDKMYYAAYKGRYYGSDSILVELDLEDKTVRDVGPIPSSTYGMASVNGDLLILFNKQIDKIDPETGTRTEIMQIGAGANYIYGSAQGEVMVQDNVLLNDGGDSTKYVSNVKGQTIGQDDTNYTKVYGDYGVLLIKPDGSYIYILNGKLDIMLDLDTGETLKDTFNYTSRYADGSQSDSSQLIITINGSDDETANYETKKSLHLDAFDLDGDKVIDTSVTDGQSVPVWHDSAGVDNQAKAVNGTPSLVLDGINGKRAVDFGGYSSGMNIASHQEINNDKFLKKTIATVFETGDSVSGIQYIFEEGGNVRGYNFAIAPDSNNVPSLYAMVYNKVEWRTDQHRSIKLTAVEPNTVYAAYMVHNAVAGTYQAYVNGDFIELKSSETLEEVDMQYVHPNPTGIGWINDDTIYPHNFVVDGNGGAPFDGLIGEVISWNDALKFQEIQDVNGQLKRKWKRAEAVSDITTKQVNDQIQITWSPAEGATSYEVYLSADGVIDNNDKKFTTSQTILNENLPAQYKTMDTLQVIVRYLKDGGLSKEASTAHTVLSKPENFVYTNLGDEYLFRFTKEDGRSYILKHSGDKEVVISSVGYVYLPTSINLETVELYEVGVEGGVPSMQAGHGVKADGPKEEALKKVENLQGTLVGSNINLTWDRFTGATKYIVYAGDDEDAMPEIARVTTNAYVFNVDPSQPANKVGFKHFKVKALTDNENVFSADSDVVAVSTPYLTQIKADLQALIDASRILHDNSHEGLKDDELIENDLYDIGEYEYGSKALFNTAITNALNKLNTSADDAEIVAALESLKTAKAEFESRIVTAQNAITLTFEDTANNELKAPVTYYGPMPNGDKNYSFNLDITIDGYTRLEGNKVTLVFESDVKTLDLVYSPNLSTAIDEAQTVIDANYPLGPNDDKFYSVGQYDEDAYNAFKSYFDSTAKPALTNGSTGAERDKIARELKRLMNAFIATHVTIDNKMTFQFVDESNQAVTVGGVSQVVKFAPDGFIRSYSPPSDNRYKPVTSPVSVTFADTALTTHVEFEITDLYKFVLQAESNLVGAVEGSNSTGYSIGQYEEGAKASLQSAIETARGILEGPVLSDSDLADAAAELENAIKAFDESKIGEDNRIEVLGVSAETGETLLVSTYYGPNGHNRTVSLATIEHYKPYVDPDKTSDGIYDTLDIAFTDKVQKVNVMYREDVSSNVPAADKENWRTTAEANIISYAQAEENPKIPWREDSRYDIGDEEDGTSKSNAKEYSDFLNILGNALKAEDKRYADPDFVEDYVKDIEMDKSVIDDYDDLITMLREYYKDISDSFYNTDGSKEKLESAKTVFYEDDIDTSVAFRIKSSGVTDPEFHFTLQGNKYLSYHYPTIKLYKLSDPDNELKDNPALLDQGRIIASDTFVETIINPDAGENEVAYGYKVVVKPKGVDTFEAGDVYYAKVITRVVVNADSTFYASETSQATTEREKHNAAVQKLVDMYEENSSEHYYLHGVLKDASGAPKKVTSITAGDLQYALGFIHDGTTSIVKGLKIVTESKWVVNGVEDGTGKREEGLSFEVESRPSLPKMF